MENPRSYQIRRLGSIKVADLPLYGSHLVKDWEAGTAIVIVEGEKAAQSLLDIGRRALGTFGADHKPNLAALEVLRDRDIILWPDNDEPGRRHMRDIATRLEGVARTTQWLEPPRERPKGWDAADLLAKRDDSNRPLFWRRR